MACNADGFGCFEDARVVAEVDLLVLDRRGNDDSPIRENMSLDFLLSEMYLIYFYLGALSVAWL